MHTHARQKQEKLAQLAQSCRQHGLPVTVQRRVILEALLDRADHPTADQVYDDVKDRVPGLSRTTVYRVLETLVRLGVARRANHLGAAARFDPNTDHHHHLVCVSCNTLQDFTDPALEALPLPDTRREQFEIADYSIYYLGTCAGCRRHKGMPPGTGGGR
jgi:Fur family peroxide stress response transcriptional regulator